MPLLLDPSARLVVAHRGNSAHAPENTLEALAQGVALGADGIECDVRLSRDGHAVVMHDAIVDRTTNGRGAVAGLTLSQLKQLDAGFHFTTDGGRTFPWRGRGTTIPALDEVLEEFRGTPMIIEIKSRDAASATLRMIERHDAATRTVVGSFSGETMIPFRSSGVAVGAARRDVVRLYLRSFLPVAPARPSYQALIIPPAYRKIPLPVLRFARLVRPSGVPTHVWTVDDPVRARWYWDGGVNAIISNNPEVILAAAGRSRGTILPASRN